MISRHLQTRRTSSSGPATKAALDVLLDRMAESEERADAEEERLAEENETGAMRCPVRE